MKLAFFKEIEIKNQEAFDNPQIGDYWNERFIPYFLIVDIKKDQYTILNALEHPDPSNVVAKVDTADGWYWDYSKTMVVDRAWLAEKLRYKTIPGFIAHVFNSEGTQKMVTEWRDYKQKELRSRIQALEDEWEEFTGWKYLKDTN